MNDWIKVADLAELDDDGTLAVEVAGKPVCLYNLGGEVHATDGKCTHGDADLSLGLIVDSKLIECPLHEGTFDIRTGAPASAPCTEAIRCHAVRVVEGAIYLRAEAA